MKFKLSLFMILPILSMAITVGDRVWLDSNQDWEQNEGEVGLGNISVNLFNENHQKIATTKTDKNGAYKFKNIEDKRYFLEVVIPAEYEATSPSSFNFWEDKDLMHLDF